MMKFCAYQERCHQEIEQKLKDMRMIPEARQEIIYKLIQENFLNEERFAQSFARGKFNQKKWGKIRIVRELKLRNISRFNIDSALKEISAEAYFNTFEEISTKKWETTREKSLLKKKKKVADYLFYRGWESNLVYEKLQELEQQEK
ncbi:regulatory protein RecX [Mesonia sp.]|uniref:regulatory protein RecX n=1 Tax=Mesonia sp. TaxID=1960830 RepID=UPI0025C3C1E6|nr:regulatory protein RecX [Mesonia sp.]